MSYWEPEEDYFEMDENFEFNTGINKILNQEVEKRLMESVKNYEEAIERDKKSQKTISDLRNEIHQLKMELNGAEKAFKKEGADQATRDMLGGFKLGDEVWFAKSNYTHENCPVCLGDKKVITDFKGEELKIRCPECDGYGYKNKTTKSAEKGTVKEIHTQTWAEGKKFEVKMYIKPTSYKSYDSIEKKLGGFFKNKEECENECK